MEQKSLVTRGKTVAQEIAPWANYWLAEARSHEQGNTSQFKTGTLKNKGDLLLKNHSDSDHTQTSS